MIKKLQMYLNAHPEFKGALIVAESTAVAAIGTEAHALLTGTAILSKQSLSAFGVTLIGAVYLSLKNYFSTPVVSTQK